MNPLQRASEYLFRRNGWCQCQLRDNIDGQAAYCLVGAINIATRGKPAERIRAKQLTLGKLFAEYPEIYGDGSMPAHELTMDSFLTSFNDTRHTKDPVIKILQKAALEWSEF